MAHISMRQTIWIFWVKSFHRRIPNDITRPRDQGESPPATESRVLKKYDDHGQQSK